MSVAGTKNFDQPPHDSNRTHLVFSTSGLLLGSRAPLVFLITWLPWLVDVGHPLGSETYMTLGSETYMDAMFGM